MNDLNENGLYLYAIVPTEEHVLFDVAGVDGGKGDVYTIPCRTLSGTPTQPLAAVVSNSALPDYRGLSRPEAATYLIAHQKVVETVMRGFPALPVKFGTVLSGESQVNQLLLQGEAKFNSALEKYGNRVQMEVIVLWNLEYVFQQIALDETVQKAKQELVNCPPEELMAKRVAVGKQVQSLLEARRNTLRAEILPALQTISQEMTINPLMDDTMVLNSALLLDEHACGRSIKPWISWMHPLRTAALSAALHWFSAVWDRFRHTALQRLRYSRFHLKPSTKPANY